MISQLGFFLLTVSKRKKCDCSHKCTNCGSSVTLPFEKMIDDAKLCIFRYLPLKDRAKLERVNKNFGTLLGTLWLKQKVLAFGTDYPKFIRICSKKSHQTLKTDFVDIVRTTPRFVLLRKCSNLVVLIWDQRRTQGRLGGILESHSMLEHLEGVIDEDLANIKHLPKLECVRINELFVVSHHDSIKRLALNSLNQHTLIQINQTEQLTLDAIIIRDLGKEEALKAIYDFSTNPINTVHAVRAWFNHFSTRSIDMAPPQEYIVWKQVFEEEVFRAMLEKSSHHVKKIRLGLKLSITAFLLIGRYCKELESIDIVTSSFIKGISQPLALLPKLTNIKIHEQYQEIQPIADKSEVSTLIPSLTHLIGFDISCITDDPDFVFAIANEMLDYAKKCKRRLHLTCHNDTFLIWRNAIKRYVSIHDLPKNFIVNDKCIITYFEQVHGQSE